VLAGGNGLGVMAGGNRNMPMPRPGLQGVNSSSMLSSGSILASSMGGMPSNMNLHSGTAAGQGNSVFRSRDALHMVRVSCFLIFVLVFSSRFCPIQRV